MRLIFVRHGKTAGNLEGRYIGCRTDEDLCSIGEEELRSRRYPRVDQVFVSPMKRCLRTARIIWPEARQTIVDDFRECDFGAFEGLNYAQLNGRADYQAWIDSGGEASFPHGESRASFSRRCVRAFEELLPGLDRQGAYGFAVHGGTIMAALEWLTRPEGRYFDFQVPCAHGYLWTPETGPRRLAEAGE